MRAAGELVRAVGCRAFTMEALARQLGASKVTLYAYFENRDGLLTRVIAEGVAAAVDELRALAGRPGPAASRRLARRLLELCLSASVGRGDPPPICCLAEVECPFADWSELDRLLAAARGGSVGGLGMARAVRAVAAAAVRGQRAGGARGHPDPDALLSLFRF